MRTFIQIRFSVFMSVICILWKHYFKSSGGSHVSTLHKWHLIYKFENTEAVCEIIINQAVITSVSLISLLKSLCFVGTW